MSVPSPTSSPAKNHMVSQKPSPVTDVCSHSCQGQVAGHPGKLTNIFSWARREGENSNKQLLCPAVAVQYPNGASGGGTAMPVWWLRGVIPSYASCK